MFRSCHDVTRERHREGKKIIETRLIYCLLDHKFADSIWVAEYSFTLVIPAAAEIIPNLLLSVVNKKLVKFSFIYTETNEWSTQRRVRWWERFSIRGWFVRKVTIVKSFFKKENLNLNFVLLFENDSWDREIKWKNRGTTLWPVYSKNPKKFGVFTSLINKYLESFQFFQWIQLKVSYLRLCKKRRNRLWSQKKGFKVAELIMNKLMFHG